MMCFFFHIQLKHDYNGVYNDNQDAI